MAWKGIIKKYGEFLSVTDAMPVVALREGYFKSGDNVVCTLTGSGLKDPDTFFKVSKVPAKAKGDLAVEGIIRDNL
jgi:threonine synthase